MLDIVALCRAHRIPYCESGNTHCRPGWVQLQCPYCGSSGTHGGWYLGFSLKQGNFHCYRCGSVKFWSVLCKLLRTDSVTAHKEVARFRNGERPTPYKAPISRRDIVEPPEGTGPMVKAHRDYLLGRGFNPSQLEREFGLLGTGPLSADWSWRVIIPIVMDSKTVAYQGRSIGKAEPKYRLTADRLCAVDPKTILYNIDNATSDSIVVVEGVTGCWRIGRGTVGTLGIDYRPQQITRLRKYQNRFILFDPEPKAQQRAMQLAEALSIYPGHTEVIGGFAEDSGAMSERDVLHLRRELKLGGAKI